MCDRFASLRQALTRAAAGFEPEAMAACEVSAVMAEASMIENVAATVKALAAARLADTVWWRRAGDASPAHHLARRSGSSVAAAAEAIDTAGRMRDQPMLAAAARAGEVSLAQASAVASAVEADPSAEARLVDKARAKAGSLAELRDDCARTRASAVDLEARRRKIHAERSLRTYTDVEGAWNLRVRDNPEVGAAIMARLDSITDRIFAEARRAGAREPRPAYAADALAELAAGSAAKGQATTNKVLARVDLAALLRAIRWAMRPVSSSATGRSRSRRCAR
jgi:hypothetical protein